MVSTLYNEKSIIMLFKFMIMLSKKFIVSGKIKLQKVYKSTKYYSIKEDIGTYL